MQMQLLELCDVPGLRHIRMVDLRGAGLHASTVAEACPGCACTGCNFIAYRARSLCNSHAHRPSAMPAVRNTESFESIDDPQGLCSPLYILQVHVHGGHQEKG